MADALCRGLEEPRVWFAGDYRVSVPFYMRRPLKTRTSKSVIHQRGSTNVYADLGYKSADEMLVKAQLVTTIAKILTECGYTQTKAAALLGIPQPKLSKMLRGQFRGFSERKLMDCLTLLGRNVEIVVRAAAKRKGQGAVSVSFA